MKQSRDALGLGKSFYLMSGCSGRNGGASALSMMGWPMWKKVMIRF